MTFEELKSYKNTNASLFIINNCSCVALLRGKSITQLLQAELYRMLTLKIQ